VSRDGKRLYVANGLSDDLTIVDTARMKAVEDAEGGPGAAHRGGR
jgi:hypothetical protein